MGKNVVIVCCWFLNNETLELTYGGSQLYLIQLTRLLQKDGWNVRIIQKSIRSFETTLDGINVSGIAMPNTRAGMARFSKAVVKLIGHDEIAIYMLLDAAFPAIHHSSIVVQHGLDWVGDDWKRALLHTYIVQPFVLRHASSIVCVDTAYINWAHTQLRHRKTFAHKLRYIPNFVDLERYDNRSSWVDQDDEKIVLFPRRMYEHRGPGFLFEAMERLWANGRNYRVVFCGFGPCSQEIRNRATRLGVTDRVEITEHTFDEMPDVYARCHVSIVPTIALEGTSLSCIESMAAGTPVIVTHIGGLANLVIPGHNGMCVDFSVEDLARAIDSILQTPSIWSRLSENGRLTAEALELGRWRNSWTSVISELGQDSRHAPSELRI